MKTILSLILSATLLLSLCACADANPAAGRRGEADTTTAETTPAVTDDPNALIAHLIHPCEIPDGYVYPEGTAQFYIDQGLWLKEDFYRPDIIWTASTLVTMDLPRPGTVRYNYGDPLSYPDTKYAFTVWLYQNTTTEMEEALATYLTGLGFELLDTRNSVDQLVFAGTGRSIEALDCTALQNAIGCPTEYGIDIRFEYQERHSHTEAAPEGKFWSCGDASNIKTDSYPPLRTAFRRFFRFSRFFFRQIVRKVGGSLVRCYKNRLLRGNGVKKRRFCAIIGISNNK